MHITGLADLARPDVRLAMPNPDCEGVARQIQEWLAKTGGEPL
jgi:ABC-type sulfate transport system substrate-binding protein